MRVMAEHVTHQMVVEAAEYIRARTCRVPRVGLILGSGLSAVAQRIPDPDIIPYGEIPHFPSSTVAGHSGRLLLGPFGGVEVLVMQGRVHYYEGYSLAETTLPIRVMRLLGLDTLIVTNAAGGLRLGLRVGDLMAITDHINFVGMAGHNPLCGPNDERFGPRFLDMSRVYDSNLLEALCAEARNRGIPLQEGVYVMLAGPNFETPAEVRFLRAIGADAVGMSTVPEVIVAHHGGMRVLGVSLISNVAHDSLEGRVKEASHEEVLEAGRRAGPVLAELLEGVLQRLSRASGQASLYPSINEKQNLSTTG